MSHLVRGRKFLGDMKYLVRSVNGAAEAVEIWTEDTRDVKRVNSLYTMVSGRFDFKINKSFWFIELVIGCQVFINKEGLYYWIIK